MLPFYTGFTVYVRDPDMRILFGAATQGNLSSGFANNKGADQLVHPDRLISAFVICFLESIISKLATSKILIF